VDVPDGPFLGTVVADAARRYGDRAAFRLPSGTELSYRDLDRLADEVAGGLAARGLGERDVLLLALPSGLEYVVAYVAAARLGATTAGANPRLRDAERARLADAVDPDLALATTEMAPTDDRSRRSKSGSRSSRAIWAATPLTAGRR